MKQLFILILSLSCLTTLYATAQNKNEQALKLLNQKFKEHHIPGLQIAVV